MSHGRTSSAVADAIEYVAKPEAKDGHHEKQKKTSDRFKLIVTACILISMITLWVGMSELIQSSESHYHKPYFFSFLVHQCYSLMLIPLAVMEWYFRRVQFPDRPALLQQYATPYKRILKISIPFAFLGLFAAWTWYVSLPLTAVAANNTVYQSGPVFVFIFSVVLLRDKVSIRKIIAVLLSFSGVATVTLSHQKSTSDSHPEPIGYVLVVVSTVTFALYEVLQKKYVEVEDDDDDASTFLDDSTLASSKPDTPSMEVPSSSSSSSDALLERPRDIVFSEIERANFSLQCRVSLLMIGAMGLWNFLWIPVFPLLNAIGQETFEWPDAHEWTPMIITSVMDIVFNTLVLIGLLVSSPLTIAVGSMLVSPTSILYSFLKGNNMPALAYLGSVLVILGFVVLNVPVEEYIARLRGNAKGYTSLNSERRGSVTASTA